MRNEIIGRILTGIIIGTIAFTLIFIITCLIGWYSYGWGLEKGLFVIHRREDAIQLAILTAAIGSGCLIAFYVYFTMVQVTQIKKQAMALLTQTEVLHTKLKIENSPILHFELRPYSFAWADFEKETEESQYLHIRYAINNPTIHPCTYEIQITPRVINYKDYPGSLDIRDTYNEKTSSDIIQIVEKDSLNGQYRRSIQPTYYSSCYFRIRLKPLTDYIKGYMEFNQDRFPMAQGRLNATEPKPILRKYIVEKERHPTITPDPIFLKVKLTAENSRYPGMFDFDNDYSYYLKLHHGDGEVNIFFVDEFSYSGN